MQTRSPTYENIKVNLPIHLKNTQRKKYVKIILHIKQAHVTSVYFNLQRYIIPHRTPR